MNMNMKITSTGANAPAYFSQLEFFGNQVFRPGKPS
jgi:hypothetical protein